MRSSAACPKSERGPLASAPGARRFVRAIKAKTNAVIQSLELFNMTSFLGTLEWHLHDDVR